MPEEYIKMDMGNIFIKKIKTKSILRIGKERALIIETDAKFNKLQKKMMKFLLNIEIEDVEEK